MTALYLQRTSVTWPRAGLLTERHQPSPNVHRCGRSPSSGPIAANDCHDDDQCLRATGTSTVTHQVLREILGPHEREGARRFRAYDGAITHPVDFMGCRRTALLEQGRHANALSAVIEPFSRRIDLDCDD